DGDVNGDGNVDLVFNSTCQRKDPDKDNTCTAGTANLVSVALGDGHGGFTLGSPQTYETSGWDGFGFTGMADVDGDGREDLVWIDRCDDFPCSGGSSLVVRVGFAKSDGTFTVTPRADLGSGYWAPQFFRLERGDVDGDGKADLILYSVGENQQDSALVYVFFSDGVGGFTASPRPPRCRCSTAAGAMGSDPSASPSAILRGMARPSSRGSMSPLPITIGSSSPVSRQRSPGRRAHRPRLRPRLPPRPRCPTARPSPVSPVHSASARRASPQRRAVAHRCRRASLVGSGRRARSSSGPRPRPPRRGRSSSAR